MFAGTENAGAAELRGQLIAFIGRKVLATQAMQSDEQIIGTLPGNQGAVAGEFGHVG